MTIQELIQYRPEQVRRDRNLFAEYLRLYEESEGRKPNCASCSFTTTFQKWKTKHTVKPKVMSNTNNTFKLKEGVNFIYVPGRPDGITKDSEDDLVRFYLSQEGVGVDTEKRKAMFDVLPEKKAKKKPAKKEDPKPTEKVVGKKDKEEKDLPKATKK